MISFYFIGQNDNNRVSYTKAKYKKLAKTNYELFQSIEYIKFDNCEETILIPPKTKKLRILNSKKLNIEKQEFPYTIEEIYIRGLTIENLDFLKIKCPNLKNLSIFNSKVLSICNLPDNLEKLELYKNKTIDIIIPNKCKDIRISCCNIREITIPNECIKFNINTKSLENIIINDDNKLETLCIQKAKIKTIPIIKNLKNLFISRISIKDLDFSGFECLTELSLQKNNLKTIKNLPNTLKEFECLNNKLETIDSILKCPLIHCKIWDNNLKDILDFSSLTKLENLEISHNKITEIMYPDSLISLFIDSNKLTKIPEIKPNLRRIYLRNNPMILNENQIETLNNLKKKNPPEYFNGIDEFNVPYSEVYNFSVSQDMLPEDYIFDYWAYGNNNIEKKSNLTNNNVSSGGFFEAN